MAISTFPTCRTSSLGSTVALRVRPAIRRHRKQKKGSREMIEKQVDVKTADGVADCDLFYPDENGKWPAIIMYTDIGGRREVFRDMGKRLAEEGFVVLVPNPFYRLSRAPVYENFKFGSESTTARMGEVRKYVTPAGAESDAHAFVDYLLSLKQVNGK